MANLVSAGTSPCSDDRRRVRYSQRVSRAAYVFALLCFFLAGYTVISTDAPTSTQPTAPNTTQLGPWNFKTPRNLPCSRMPCGHMTLRPWEHPTYTQPATGLSQCGQLQAQSRAHAKRPKAVVTFLSSPNYLPMVFTLLQSLSASGYRGERVVATLAPASEDERREKAEMLGRLLQKFPGVQTTTWRMMLPRTKTAELPRWTKNYAKLNLFQMTAYSTMLYIDADILVLQHPRVIFKHAVELDVETTENMRWFWSAPDWGAWTRPPSASMNGGVLLLRPSMELFKCMTRVLHSINSAEYSHQSAEQGFLRYFFGDEATTLPALFNMQKSNLGFLRASFLGDEATTPTTELSYRNDLQLTASWNRIVLLHYTGSKPFRTWSSPLYLKEYRDALTRISLIKEDLIDDEEEMHVPALNVWRQYYFTVAGFSTQLSLFVAYHDQASHAQIRALREAHPPGVLTLPGNLSTIRELAELRDPLLQLQLGENAALLAVAAASWYHKPWVGFTTASETRKARWREGVSLDWTKVYDAINPIRPSNGRVVLFWYGIFAHDYWALLEAHHPGMKPVIMQVLVDMRANGLALDPSRLEEMPADRFWPFGNYIILPSELLREYATFARHFISVYKSRRPVGVVCPFGTQETNTPNWEKRCIGYMLERLIHWWSILANVTLTYAVDDEQIRYKAACALSQLHCRVADTDRGVRYYAHAAPGGSCSTGFMSVTNFVANKHTCPSEAPFCVGFQVKESWGMCVTRQALPQALRHEKKRRKDRLEYNARKKKILILILLLICLAGCWWAKKNGKLDDIMDKLLQTMPGNHEG